MLRWSRNSRTPKHDAGTPRVGNSGLSTSPRAAGTPGPHIHSTPTPDSEEHPFGGCERLLAQYRNIGAELLTIEAEPKESVEATAEKFRFAVAYIPVQVLEAYLEDLLDLDVGESTLFIRPPTSCANMKWFFLSGLLFGACAVGAWYLVVELHAGVAIGFALSFLVAPVGLLLVRPYWSLMRRLRFAQVLSREIARRRGTDPDHRGRTATLIISEFLAGASLRHGGYGHSSTRMLVDECRNLDAETKMGLVHLAMNQALILS